MKRSGIGRVDLLDLRVNQPDLLDLLTDPSSARAKALANLLGYERRQEPNRAGGKQPSPGGPTTGPSETRATEIERRPLRDAVFWYASGYDALPEDAVGRQRIAQAVAPPEPIVIEAPAFDHLSTWAELEPRLRTALAHRWDSHRLDMPRLVEQLGRARLPTTLPYEPRSGWGSSLQVIDDRNRHLAPYLIDHAMVQQQLALLFPGDALETALLDAAFDEPMIQTVDGGLAAYRPPVGGRVLILSDLGCLARDSGRTGRFWTGFGRRLQAVRCEALVLLPCSPKQCSAELRLLYNLISWEHPAPPLLNQAQGEAACERLLQLLAPVWCFTPGLLRAVRLALGADAPPASVESLLWQHPATQELNLTVSALNPEEKERWQRGFAARDQALHQRVLSRMRAWHHDRPPEIWYSTLWNLSSEARRLVKTEELTKAKRFLAHIANRSREGSAKPLKANARAWVARNLAQLSESARNDPELKEPIRALRQALRGWQQQSDSEAAASERLCLSQRGSDLCLCREGAVQAHGASPLFELGPSVGELTLLIPSDHRAESFWQSGKAPAWANAWGHDDYGPWVEFLYKDIRQRMRWIPAGRFLMGSPETESGRWNDEGPRHPVVLKQGYWLFDTPVTQALWQAVIGNNPSRFKSPDRPVERVSWDDCRVFLERINARLPDLALSLPSEAQWERACRAGSERAIYTGELTIDGERNAPELDAIAWYGGNSGMDFQLEDGSDVSDWKEKQYQFDKAGTQPVGRKAPNPWGLYDMLGNVWEWTADTQHGDYTEAPKDGSAWDSEEAGARRVIRGGSWGDRARFCRSACRNWIPRGGRDDILGFRPARSQVSQAGQVEAQPATPGVSAQAERADHRGWRGGAVALRLPLDRQMVTYGIPDADRLRLCTDREILTLRRRARPRWARAMGRDAFGFWADFTLDASEGPVRQRLRWIPPGCFLMGSPATEPGRFNNEGPQHPVVLRKGYWLFDTPVTQALWQAVLGDNPSRFRSPDGPVEQVSWDDCRGFLEKINDAVPGVELGLPSEAQWEYACRAGSETAIYTGHLEIEGANNAPGLDAIASYGGNSGRDFEIDDGVDSSGWPEKQYEFDRAGTNPVDRKSPNPWGLYDMLGNVWEWTADAWHASYEGAPSDGSVWDEREAGAGRVFRGGSWDGEARICRSACRSWARPGRRIDGLGFRPARAQE